MESCLSSYIIGTKQTYIIYDLLWQKYYMNTSFGSDLAIYKSLYSKPTKCIWKFVWMFQAAKKGASMTVVGFIFSCPQLVVFLTSPLFGALVNDLLYPELGDIDMSSLIFRSKRPSREAVLSETNNTIAIRTVLEAILNLSQDYLMTHQR